MNILKCKEEIEKLGKLPENYYILGIDLGTTNSVISYWDDIKKRPEPIDISNGFGKIPMPSVVQYRSDENESEEWIIGEEAYRSMKLYPESTVSSIKRRMGSQDKIKINNKEYLPEEISAKILCELIEFCKNLNPKAQIAGVVVSVPYDFDDAAKKATIRACEIAGIKENLICLIEEPKAAALAYNFRHKLSLDENIMVFDFGGGTLDVTIFKVTEKDETRIKLQVISEGGEAYHGGDNIDDMILKKCYEYIKSKSELKEYDISVENKVELFIKARETKERLSGVKSYRIPFTFCIPPFVEQITREDFEILIQNFIEKTKSLVLKALRETYTGPLEPENIDRVLLEGGSSQMPWVKSMLLSIFNDENKIYISERAALDISIGATYYAAMKMGLIKEPDLEAIRSIVDFEITLPHDIGVEIVNSNKKSFFNMIRRGTSYSLAKKSHIFTLTGDTQEEMTMFNLKILERIHKDDKYEDCKLIGEVEINGLPKRPKGKTKLKIDLQVDEETGTVTGAVEDLGYEKEYPSSNFKAVFDPVRSSKTILER